MLTLSIDLPDAMLTTNEDASAVSTSAAATRRTPSTKLKLAAAKLGLLLCRAPAAWDCIPDVPTRHNLTHVLGVVLVINGTNVDRTQTVAAGLHTR